MAVQASEAPPGPSAFERLDGGEVEGIVTGHHVAHVGVGLPALPVDEQPEQPAQERALHVRPLDAGRLAVDDLAS